MLLSLPFSPPARFSIAPGSWKRGVVRVYFVNKLEQRCCLDSRILNRKTAIKLAAQLARNGVECEVLGYQFNMVRPPPHTVHRCRRLEDLPATIAQEAL